MVYYAQKNYQQILGKNGIVSIAAAGCFLTSFCNVEARKGTPIDPPSLNNYFISNNLFYFDEGSIYDLLAWSSVTFYDPTVTVTKVGVGAPTVDDAIVKFIYNGGVTHFCLVESAANHTIIDSYDGKVKSWDVYGGPKEYATYNIIEGDTMGSTVGEVEFHDLFECNFGPMERNEPTEGDRKRWVGAETNTVIREMQADPRHFSWLQYIADLEKAAASSDGSSEAKFAPYAGKQLYTQE